ncbi:MAG TPA: hypothetical protein VNH46_08340 [Gemmatimonadales bacterium]|nr:hypothetical protein [Gemmatimonadales bacterium]
MHLRTLARVEGQGGVELEVGPPATLGAALAALEDRFPVLRGAIRDHGTLKRRPFIRYYACGQDLSLEPIGTPLPDPVQRGEEPLMIIGALAGG